MSIPQIVPQKQFGTLDLFIEGMNNYWAHFFRGNEWAETRRKRPHFLRFQEQNPEMEHELTDKITKIANTTRRREYMPLETLWESYNLMSQLVYAEDAGVMGYSDPSTYLLS